ncbi:MAG: hypothetical protein ABIT20_08070 [Gemmatimonadaceae bacterium]
MRTLLRGVSTTAAVTLLATVACSTQSRLPADDTTSKPTGGAPNAASSGATNDSAAARSRITQLEADARALARTTGCNTATACRTAPVGERACGGPRDYIAYCAATTDSVALFRKLDEIKAAEVAFNKASNAMSTCEFRMPPQTAVVGGSCRAAAEP